MAVPPVRGDRATVDHLHRLAQIGGKYTLDQLFEFNWANIVLPITPREFSTPTLHAGDVLFDVDYALLDERVTINATTGRASLPLAPGTVAGFYERFVEAVAPLGIAPLQTTVEPEIPDAPTLDEDRERRPTTAGWPGGFGRRRFMPTCRRHRTGLQTPTSASREPPM